MKESLISKDKLRNQNTIKLENNKKFILVIIIYKISNNTAKEYKIVLAQLNSTIEQENLARICRNRIFMDNKMLPCNNKILIVLILLESVLKVFYLISYDNFIEKYVLIIFL